MPAKKHTTMRLAPDVREALASRARTLGLTHTEYIERLIRKDTKTKPPAPRPQSLFD